MTTALRVSEEHLQVEDLMVFSSFGFGEVADLFELKGGEADLQV